MKGKGLIRYINNNRGSGVLAVILTGALLVFIIFPIFSFTMEKYLLNIKAQQLKASIDITNLAAYNAMKVQQVSQKSQSMDEKDIEAIFQELLTLNLKLNGDMTPQKDSLADDKVMINSIEIYQGSFPAVCTLGKDLYRSSVHSVITVPIKPMLYRGIILSAIGKEYIEMIIHVDSEIPMDD